MSIRKIHADAIVKANLMGLSPTFYKEAAQFVKTGSLLPLLAIPFAEEGNRCIEQLKGVFINSSNLCEGMKVVYNTGAIMGVVEKGIIKSLKDENNSYVVFKCNSKWTKYKEYTGVLVANKYLTTGWPLKKS